MKTTTATFIGIVACVILAVAAYQLGSASQRRTTAEWHAEREALLRRLAEAEKQARLLGRKNPPRLAAGGPDQKEVEMSEPAAAEKRAVNVAFEAAVPVAGVSYGRPEALHEHTREFLRQRYEPWLRNTALTREQADRLADLLVERQLAARDVVDAALDHGLKLGPENHAELKTLMHTAQAAVEDRIRALLGAETYQQFHDYERTLPHRDTIEQLSSRLGLVGETLSAAQNEQLLKLLTSQTPSTDSTAELGPPMLGLGPTVVVQRAVGDGSEMAFGAVHVAVGGGGEITGDALAQSRNVLNETQWKALQQLQADRERARRAVGSKPGQK